MSLPPNFGVVGCGDELAAEIDDEFRHFFPTSSVKPNNSGKTECNPSVTGECRDDDVDTDCDIGSDVEDDELSGNEGLLRSPIIHSRVRVFMRDANCNGNTDDSDHDDDDDGDDDDDYERTQILTAHKKCTKHCLAKFRDADVLENRLNVQEMDKDVKDMLIIGQLQACGTTKGADATLVKRHRYDYQFQNTSVCKSCFLYINNINGHYLKNVRAHFLKNGAVPRVHGNSGKKPKNAVRYEHVQQVIQFISRYADEVGLPQPAAPRGRDDFPPTYLPGCETYISVHQKYIQVCHETQSRCLSETTFRRIWHQCLPHIQFMTCRTDVCHKCEIFRNLIQKAVTEADKLQASTEYAEHISSAQEERNFYRERCRAAVTSLQGHPKSSVPVPHASVDLDDVHYTFDFAQSVLLPSHCRQEGALYFRSPYKANLFGVCNDGRTLQTNYLFGEDQSFDQDGVGSHSANAVVSMLHHFFQNHGEGEKTVFLNADNCGGQNKNQVVTSYLAWRVANGYHENIHLHFMKPYHARCLVDGMFGIARRKIRRSDVDSLPQLKTAVETSSTHNQADLYSELSANSWVWRDWKKFFKPIFRAVPGIGKCHHFHFAATNAGVVKVKTAVDGEETEVRLVKRGKNIPEGLPVRLEAKGLSPLRAWYLYKNIRPFVKDPCKDLLCPLPDVPEPPTGGSIQTEE